MHDEVDVLVDVEFCLQHVVQVVDDVIRAPALKLIHLGEGTVELRGVAFGVVNSRLTRRKVVQMGYEARIEEAVPVDAHSAIALDYLDYVFDICVRQGRLPARSVEFPVDDMEGYIERLLVGKGDVKRFLDAGDRVSADFRLLGE